MTTKILITQVRSIVGRPADQRRTVRALGLRKIGQTRMHEDTPSVRGMLFKVRHLVDVQPVAEEENA